MFLDFSYNGGIKAKVQAQSSVVSSRIQNTKLKELKDEGDLDLYAQAVY